ncbi:hypothetical protein WA158_001390 [Blastocystis sp. Blastoise]
MENNEKTLKDTLQVLGNDVNYRRHKELMESYIYNKAKQNESQMSKTRSDYDVLVDNHQFIRDDLKDKKNQSNWEVKMARDYYDRLNKEYALANMKKYEENKIGLRWRLEKEVIDGKGQFICGNIDCNQIDDLHSYEVLFTYVENKEVKHTLIKLRLCPYCALKLYYKKITEYEKTHGKVLNSKLTAKDIFSYILTVLNPPSQNSISIQSNTQTISKENNSNTPYSHSLGSNSKSITDHHHSPSPSPSVSSSLKSQHSSHNHSNHSKSKSESINNDRNHNNKHNHHHHHSCHHHHHNSKDIINQDINKDIQSKLNKTQTSEHPKIDSLSKDNNNNSIIIKDKLSSKNEDNKEMISKKRLLPVENPISQVIEKPKRIKKSRYESDSSSSEDEIHDSIKDDNTQTINKSTVKPKSNENNTKQISSKQQNNKSIPHETKDIWKAERVVEATEQDTVDQYLSSLFF